MTTNEYCWYNSSKDIMRVFYWSHKLSWKVSLTSSNARAVSWISTDHGGSSRLSYGWHHRRLVIYQNLQFSSSLPHLSSSIQTAIPWKSSMCQNPMKKLEAALERDSVDEAWEDFSSYKRLHGFPKKVAVKRMISLMTSSFSSHWLLRAYELVLVVLYKSPHLLDYESLTRLALILARSQMPVPASTIIRIALDKFKFPSLDILSTIFFHLVKSDIGSYLASNIMIEICEMSMHQRADTRKDSKKPKILNPNVTMFNLVLYSCSKFESFQKAMLIIKLMSQVGVIADANSIVIFAQIYEKVGQRDELIKLKIHVDSILFTTFNRHYCKFYDSLLSLHFRYNDLDAAAKLMLKLYSQSKSLQYGDSFPLKNGKIKACSLQIGSGNLSMGYKVRVDPELLGTDFIVDSTVQPGLVLFSDGKLLPSTKALAKLINGFVKERRVGDVSNLLINIEKNIFPKKGSFNTPVLVAFIKLGWLETAHDLLDDLEVADISVDAGLYKSLFKAYRKQNLFEESKVLLKQMRIKGLFGSLSDEEAVQSCLSADCYIRPLDNEGYFTLDNSCLAGHLYREIREGDFACHWVYEFNSTILFFCQASMMEDAIRTVKRMQQKNIPPTTQTFSCLLNGYSSLKMYRQITMLWGEVNRRLNEEVLTVDRDLLDCFLMNFLRGGYFERVMEVANYMRKHDVFADKWKYKDEFLKLHEALYRNLKAVHAKTDAQRLRLEHVHAFRKWVNIPKL